MNGSAGAATSPAEEGCPRCKAPGAIQRLLTSMVRYYLCGHCDWRWQVSRDPFVKRQDEFRATGTPRPASAQRVLIVDDSRPAPAHPSS
jgi:hypothetical protein